jgi:hypothetical protein
MIKAMQEDNKRKFEAIERQDTELQGFRSGSLPYAGAVIELRRIMDDLGEPCVGRTDAQKLNVVRMYLEARKSDALRMAELCTHAQREAAQANVTLRQVRTLVAEPHTKRSLYMPTTEESWGLQPNPFGTASEVRAAIQQGYKVDVHRLLKEYFANNGATNPNPSPQSIRSITQALNNQGFGVK